MTDRIKALVDKLEKATTPEKRGRSNHTLYLDTDNYMTLSRYCKSRNQKVSEVVDALIADLIEELRRRGIE